MKRAPRYCYPYWWELDRQWLRLKYYLASWISPCPPEVLAAVKDLGISESQVRDYRYHHAKDMITVRLWNYRKFDFTGLVIFQYKQMFKATKITGMRNAGS